MKRQPTEQDFESQIDFCRGRLIQQGTAKNIYALWKKVGGAYTIVEHRLNDKLSIVNMIKNPENDCENCFFLVSGPIGKKLNME